YLLRRHRLMPEILIQTGQYRTPLFVVVDDLADRVEHITALVIHVARALAICSISADDRTVVSDVAAAADYIILPGLLAEPIFYKQVFRVIGKPLVDPHIGRISHRDV